MAQNDDDTEIEEMVSKKFTISKDNLQLLKMMAPMHQIENPQIVKEAEIMSEIVNNAIRHYFDNDYKKKLEEF